VFRISSPKLNPTARSGQKRERSISARTRPPIIAKTSAVAEMSRVICIPDIRKSKLLGMMSQRN
jgi:hypothetical protein